MKNEKNMTPTTPTLTGVSAAGPVLQSCAAGRLFGEKRAIGRGFLL